MANFNTYQTRQLYVANAIKTALNGLTAVGDIMLGKNENDEDIFFHYVNASGNIVRSDSIKVKNINYVKKTAAADMATPLKQLLIAVDTNAIDVTSSANYGKVLDLLIHVREFTSYDDADSIAVAASVVLSADTNTTTKFHKALAMAIAKALGKKGYFKVFSNGSEVTYKTAESGVTGTSAGVTITQTAQKYVRGKMSNEPLEIDVEFHLHAADADIQWGTATKLKSGDTGYVSGQASIPGYFKVADLEHFAAGERGDYMRGYLYPNDYEFVPLVKIDGTVSYDIVSIEYFYQGGAENVQKSPRLIQIAASSANASTLYDAIEAIMAGVASS